MRCFVGMRCIIGVLAGLAGTPAPEAFAPATSAGRGIMCETDTRQAQQGSAWERKGKPMELQIRPYTADDIKAMVRIWNEVVEAGDAFPQVTPLTEQNADEFFSAQTATMVADVNGIIFGFMYILHPNDIGRCAHRQRQLRRGLGLITASALAVSWWGTASGLREELPRQRSSTPWSPQTLARSTSTSPSGFTKVSKIPRRFRQRPRRLRGHVHLLHRHARHRPPAGPDHSGLESSTCAPSPAIGLPPCAPR